MKFIKIDDDLVNLEYISFICFDDIDNKISIFTGDSSIPMSYEYEDNYNYYLDLKRYIIKNVIENSEV